MRCGYWTHVRRKFIEALGVARDICWNFIDDIGTLFAHEGSFVDLDPLERRERRRNLLSEKNSPAALFLAPLDVMLGYKLVQKFLNGRYADSRHLPHVLESECGLRSHSDT